MNAIGRLSKGALGMLRNALGGPVFTWKGAEIPCVPSTLDVGSTVVIGGYEVTLTTVLRVERSEFLTADSTLVSVDSTAYTVDNGKPTPMSGKTLIYNGATYRIQRTTFSPDGAFLSIFLGDPNR